MTAALAVGCAVLTVLLAVPRSAARRLGSRLRAGPGVAEPRTGVRLAMVLGGVVLALGLVAAGGAVHGWPGAVVGTALVIAGGTAARLVAASVRRRRVSRAESDVAAACAVLASYVRVGQVATSALQLAAHDCAVLAEADEILRIGGDVPATWRAQARRPGHSGLADLARAWQVSVSTGAPLSGALEQVAGGLSADQNLRAVVAGELSAPRATGKVMAVLPLLGVALGYALGGDPVRWLLAGPLGWACLLVGLLLAALGVTWIERLARSAAEQA